MSAIISANNGAHYILLREELIRFLVVDGNFTADHLRQKQNDLDVYLSEGQGMMTMQMPYMDHLGLAEDTMEVID